MSVNNTLPVPSIATIAIVLQIAASVHSRLTQSHLLSDNGQNTLNLNARATLAATLLEKELSARTSL